MPVSAGIRPTPASTRLQVGKWVVEPALNQFSAAGRTLRLEPKAMAVLVYLAEHAGEVASRESLLSAVWPEVIVGDDSLTQAVIKLRKALGDVAESPAYIQTISKGGYRLIAPVSRVAVPDSATAPAAGKSKSRIHRWLTPAAAALLLVAAAAWWSAADGEDPPAFDAASVADTERTRSAQPTIAIVPFETLGDDAEAALVARGITADLLTDLSEVFALSVISGVPSLKPDAGAALRLTVRYVVSGSVQRVDNRLRLHIRLLDAPGGRQIWSERYDRPLASLYAMQEELVATILKTLSARVSEAELRRIAQRHTHNLKAYEALQLGQAALLLREREENEKARELFRRAIALDPSFALAYAALALTYAADHRNQWAKDRAAAVERALQLARTAYEINPNLREAHWVLALVHLERGQHRKALDFLETAVRISPSYADAYALMGGINAYIGRPANALPLLRTAIRLNPDGGHLYSLILGRAYYALGDFEQARINLQLSLARNPVNLEARVYLAATHVAVGNNADSAWEAEEIRVLQRDFAADTWLATHPLTDRETRSKLESALGQIGL